MIDWINDLNTLRDSESNISSNNYPNSPTELMYPNTIYVSVYEGPGTGMDGGGGVNYYTDGYSTNLQNGSYELPIGNKAKFSSGYVDNIGDTWEDKWVDVYYAGYQIAHVHIGNNTPDAVMNYTINLNDIINVILSNNNAMNTIASNPDITNMYPDFPDFPTYPDYSEQNYWSGQGTYNPWGGWYPLDNNTGIYYDPYYTPDWILEERRKDYEYSKEFINDGLPIGGNWATWGDKIYDSFAGFADKYFSWNPSVNYGIKFTGGVLGCLVGGYFGLAYGTGWAAGKTLATGDTGYLNWWGTQVAGGLVDTINAPTKSLDYAIQGDYNKAIDPKMWGEFASIPVGIIGPKVAWKAVAKVGDWYRTRNLPKLNEADYIHPEAMDASKPVFPAAKSFEHLKKSFEDAGNKVITFTPDKIVGDVVGDSRKGALGLEDSGIYVAPKGYGNPYFTRKADYSLSLEEAKKGVEFKWNLFENIKEKWQKYGKTGRVYETQVKGVVEPPKDVLMKPGFSAVNKWGQENLVGTGYIRFTKRAMLGQGVIKRQNFWNPELKKWDIEHGTKEFEAIIDKGYKFVDEGPVGYIEWGGRRIIVNEFSLLDNQGRKIGKTYIENNAIIKGITGKNGGNRISNSIMDYNEFARKIKEYTKPYYDETYTINLDSSIYYLNPNIDYNTTVNYDSNIDFSKDNYKNKYTKTTNYENSYNINYDDYSKYTTDYSKYITYGGYSSYGSYSGYPTKYPPITPPPTPPTIPPDITLTPPYTPPTPPVKPPITPTRIRKKKRKKADEDILRVIPKIWKQGAATSKRDWYVKDLEKAFRDVEKQMKALEKSFNF